MSRPPYYQSLTEVGRQIRSRQISPVDLVETLLQRIETVDGRLNSYYTVTSDLAREQARIAEAEIRSGRYRGPLHGIPIAVKDLCFTKDIVTTGGMTMHRDFRPSYNATVVDRLYKGGAIMMGKLRLTEGACIEHHPDMGRPTNPWRDDLWTGTSSSGSGVGVSTGLCFASIGSDTGGSIRFPSAMNNVTGIKPTWGRVSRYGIWDLAPSYDHLGPIARSADDLAAMLMTIAGEDPADPTTLLDPVPDYRSELSGVEGARGLRIGIDETYNNTGADPEVIELMEGVRETLQALGARMRTVEFPDHEPMSINMPDVHMAELAHSHRNTYPAQKESYGKWITVGLSDGYGLKPLDFARTMIERDRFKGQLNRLFRDIDALLIPVFSFASPTWAEMDHIMENDPDKLFRFTTPFNASGNPTVVFPAGFTRDGRPIGAQLVGAHLSEATLLRAVHAYQQATDWHLRRPALD